MWPFATSAALAVDSEVPYCLLLVRPLGLHPESLVTMVILVSGLHVFHVHPPSCSHLRKPFACEVTFTDPGVRTWTSWGLLLGALRSPFCSKKSISWEVISGKHMHPRIEPPAASGTCRGRRRVLSAAVTILTGQGGGHMDGVGEAYCSLKLGGRSLHAGDPPPPCPVFWDL